MRVPMQLRMQVMSTVMPPLVAGVCFSVLLPRLQVGDTATLAVLTVSCSSIQPLTQPLLLATEIPHLPHVTQPRILSLLIWPLLELWFPPVSELW